MPVRCRTGDRALRSLLKHNIFCAQQQQVLPTDQRSRHGIPSISHSVQPLHGEFREDSVVVCIKPPSVWLRYMWTIRLWRYMSTTWMVSLHIQTAQIATFSSPQNRNLTTSCHSLIYVFMWMKMGVLKSRSIGSPCTPISTSTSRLTTPWSTNAQWSEH